MTTTCRKCGATLPGGTLLAHDKAMHPAAVLPAARPRTCYRPACVDYYGPSGHVVGRTGPHVYGGAK
jgi:hypothetical protein